MLNSYCLRQKSCWIHVTWRLDCSWYSPRFLEVTLVLRYHRCQRYWKRSSTAVSYFQASVYIRLWWLMLEVLRLKLRLLLSCCRGFSPRVPIETVSWREQRDGMCGLYRDRVCAPKRSRFPQRDLNDACRFHSGKACLCITREREFLTGLRNWVESFQIIAAGDNFARKADINILLRSLTSNGTQPLPQSQRKGYFRWALHPPTVRWLSLRENQFRFGTSNCSMDRDLVSWLFLWLIDSARVVVSESPKLWSSGPS